MGEDSSTQGLEARKSIYDFLAFVYLKELTVPVLNQLHESGLLEKLNEEGSSFDLDSLRPVDEEVRVELARQYARVFIGPGKHVPPYESVHNPSDPKRGRLWGDSTIDMKKMIEFAGLKFEGKAYHGIPDHVSVGFEFMSALLGKEIEGRKTGDERTANTARKIQRRFYAEHMKPWIPIFCDLVIAQPGTNFYQQVGMLTRDFIAAEGELFGIESESPAEKLVQISSRDSN